MKIEFLLMAGVCFLLFVASLFVFLKTKKYRESHAAYLAGAEELKKMQYDLSLGFMLISAFSAVLLFYNGLGSTQ